MYLSKQEIFDKVKKHLLTQNKKCMRGSTFSYGSKYSDIACAIGCLIPLEMRTEANYYQSIDNLDKRFWEAMRILKTDENKSFLIALQQIHDSHATASWRDELKQFSRRFKLNYGN